MLVICNAKHVRIQHIHFASNRLLSTTVLPGVASGKCSSGFMRVNKDTPCGKILSSISSVFACFHYAQNPVVHHKATGNVITKSSIFDLTEKLAD